MDESTITMLPPTTTYPFLFVGVLLFVWGIMDIRKNVIEDPPMSPGLNPLDMLFLWRFLVGFCIIAFFGLHAILYDIRTNQEDKQNKQTTGEIKCAIHKI